MSEIQQLYSEKERPPLVRFAEAELGLDPQASKEAGRPVPRVVLMAFITQQGSRDVFEQPAEEWIAKISAKAANGEYNPEHAAMFRRQFESYKAGNELPREGTPIKTWQLGTGQQRARLIACQITTVEDLAATPDSGLATIGLDGRVLRDMARAWIAEGKEKGSVATDLANANAEIDRLRERTEQQDALINGLSARLEALESAGNGTPRKQRAAG
jgi:hypothetical protein